MAPPNSTIEDQITAARIALFIAQHAGKDKGSRISPLFREGKSFPYSMHRVLLQSSVRLMMLMFDERCCRHRNTSVGDGRERPRERPLFFSNRACIVEERKGVSSPSQRRRVEVIVTLVRSTRSWRTTLACLARMAKRDNLSSRDVSPRKICQFFVQVFDPFLHVLDKN